MIKVKLVAHTDENPLSLASHAALMCYQPEVPAMGKQIDVEKRLFGVGHHTTLQHTYFTFSIEGISVGDITFGMHLAHPFYNSDQRSGRYCAKMFEEPNFSDIENYVTTFWPKLSLAKKKKVMKYIKKSVGLYHDNIDDAKRIASQFLREERPYINEKFIEQTAPKIGQEQLRVFIPVIFPTAFDFTINTTVLVAMYETAWTPAMKMVTEKMASLVLERVPEMTFMFDEKRRKSGEWALEIPKGKSAKLKYKPEVKLLDILDEKGFVMPKSEEMHPIDKLHFEPEMMDNSFGGLLTQIELSTATMGQDQRHRTISRGKPAFSGNFYLPPIAAGMKLQREAKELMNDWLALSKEVPETLAMILAPYGAMVKYKKKGSFNAIAHEQGKRLCWCAQEEIYHAGLLLRKEIETKSGKKSKLLQIFEPPCYRTGRCAEGARYCGRDMKKRSEGDYFPERKV
jgi:hypothetical protein